MKELTTRQVAERAGVKLITVRRWAEEGIQVRGRIVKLGGEKVGARWRFTEESLLAFKRACSPNQEVKPIEVKGGEGHREAVERLRRRGIKV